MAPLAEPGGRQQGAVPEGQPVVLGDNGEQEAVLSAKEKQVGDSERTNEGVFRGGARARLTCRKPFLVNCKIFKA